MSISRARIGAVIRKELTEFRRSRMIMYTMGIIPLVFLIAPTATILKISLVQPSAAMDQKIGFMILYLQLIPVLIPATIAGYSIVGEREQGTLEPVLTTPLRREELLIGKAAAALIPAIALSYLVLGVFLLVVRFGADPAVATAVWHAPELVAVLFFIPLLAAWAIWVGLAISTKASDVRVSQQLGMLASLPPLALTLLLAFQVISSTLILTVSLAGVLLIIDCAAYLVVSRLFDRERLVTGTKPSGYRTSRGLAGLGRRGVSQS